VLKIWVENLGKKFHKKTTWFSFFKKLLSRSTSKIERKTKWLIALRWDWNTVISTMRLFYQVNVTFSKKKFWKIIKMAFINESYKLLFQQDAQTTWKIRLSITFSLLVQIEWIKSSHVEKKYIILENNLKFWILNFCKFFLLSVEFWAFCGITFALGHQLK